MKYSTVLFFVTLCAITISTTSCNNTVTSDNNVTSKPEVVGIPEVAYPLPIVDYISNNCDPIKKRSIEHNPSVYILRGINDIWKGTTDEYQHGSSEHGPGKNDYVTTNPIIDSVIWKENITYVINVTNNRTDDEAILAYLDDVRSKFYSVIDGFGPLTEAYVKNSGAYVDLPEIKKEDVLENTHYQSSYNNNQRYAGSETSPLGAVVKLARSFQNTCSSTNAPKYLYSTPRPWRMNANGEVVFKGTTYDTQLHKPTYLTKDYIGNIEYKIFDIYESNVQVVSGLMASRKNHKYIYDDSHPKPEDLYTNTTQNIRTDNGYPSGHTNAGAIISLAYAYAFPERFQELVFRGSQLGEDRIIAGMHSPVDVIGGKLMALATACAALNQSETSEIAKEARQVTLDFFGAKADSLEMSLQDYAHQKIDTPKEFTNGDMINISVFDNNKYDDKEILKKLYRFRLTYGFTQDTTKSHALPIVPKGAEVILKTRFPYLSDEQRRAVLYTTELPSGYKILDKTNGWGRIDLFTAADGYGAFIDNVTVTMNANLGSFNAYDSWNNPIDGKGKLTKKGTGTLLLTGNNSYTGGTSIEEGTLKTNAETALGTRKTTITNNGILEILTPLKLTTLHVNQQGKISIHYTTKNHYSLEVKEEVVLQNSSLEIIFTKEPSVGDRLPIIKCKNIKGEFNTIINHQFMCHTSITDGILYLVIDSKK
ncbi:serine protease [Neptunitalea chrysea]|uniref:Serine protease n=1 Tax=Neptunitalea chrysea TaxID=1647581 RepID=A0A9W6EV67_9FLAO|nr:phosphatase PAP2 family protein [Neptunitalea chrysea]GLB51173.1 serine protease [Neptunitalea chrysea]